MAAFLKEVLYRAKKEGCKLQEFAVQHVKLDALAPSLPLTLIRASVVFKKSWLRHVESRKSESVPGDKQEMWRDGNSAILSLQT